MPVEGSLGHAGTLRINGQSKDSHARDSFKHNRGVRRIGRCRTPRERCMSGNKSSRRRRWIEAVLLLEEPDDGEAGVQNIVAVDLFIGERISYGNGAVEVVGVSGAESRN